MDCAFLKLFFGEREELHVPWYFCRIYNWDTGGDAECPKTSAYGACQGVVDCMRDIADLYSGWVAFGSCAHGGENLVQRQMITVAKMRVYLDVIIMAIL